MLSEQVIEKLVERIVDKIEEENLFIMKKIGASVGELRKLTPTQAQQLAQILKYGGNYNEIVNEIKRIAKINEKEIDEIFKEVAKENQMFAKKFYDYKGIKFIPFENNKALIRQVNALANITKKEFFNFSNTKAIGYHITDNEGNVIFQNISDTYKSIIDKSVLAVAQGKETFDSVMFRDLKELGEGGLRYIDYESGRTMRLDSAVRMNMQGALRNLSNELQQQFGEEYGADGVEISVHLNPAPDHTDAQGKQFTKDEFEKLQTYGTAKTYTGEEIDMTNKSGSHRPISELNCYHYIFDIVLGVSKPRYSEAQLKEINEQNEKGFEYEGKHYSMYEGQQLQRRIETAIRKQKDLHIFAKASGNEQLLYNSQNKINQLSVKYNDLCNVSGLKKRAERLRVSGYKKIAIKK